MSYLMATANGNWTDAATWGLVDATSLLDSEGSSTSLTTSYVESQTFTPGAITVDGIAVKISTRNGSTGTMSVRLAQAGATVAGTEVTINITDIPNLQTSVAGCNGWILFKFAAPVTLLAATIYTMSAKASTVNQVVIYRNATPGNWSRQLRTTATQAPVAGDTMFVLGEWTAAATKTNRTVTMNETASTDYGSASTTLPSLGIGVGGTLTYGTTAATPYVLRLSGVLDVWAEGTLAIGTSGTPIPRDSTAVLEFDCAADGDFGLRLWSTATYQAHGLSRTSGKDVVQCLLNTDEAIAQTVLGVDTDTGWLDTDEIAIASTSMTGTDAETATLSGAAGASSITISAGLAAAHGGNATTLVQAEVILLTRNVRVRSVSSTAMAYMNCNGATLGLAGATVNWSWVDFRYMGSNAGTGKQAFFEAILQPASLTAAFCNFRNGEMNGLQINASGVDLPDGTLTLTDCTFYSVATGSSMNLIDLKNQSVAAGCIVTVSITRCTWIQDSNTSSGQAFFVTADHDSPFLIDSCRASSGTGCFVSIQGTGTTMPYSASRRITGCNCHCLTAGTGSGLISISQSAGLNGLVIDNCVFWRITGGGSGNGIISIAGSAATHGLLIEDCIFFGGYSQAIGVLAPASGVVRNCTFAGDTTFSAARAWGTTQNTISTQWRFENCSFGVATGIQVAHTGHAFGSSSGSLGNGFHEFTLVNCNIADATEFSTVLLDSMLGESFIVKHRKDQVTNVHEKVYPRIGTVAYETTTFRTAAPSRKLTPTLGLSDYFKLRSAPKTYPVASGKKITFNVYVQKDGSYAGNAPRLVLLANAALGIDDDTVLDTLSVSSGTWELLTGQMAANAEEAGAVQAVVECDGSAGNIYVDDWSASTT